MSQPMSDPHLPDVEAKPYDGSNIDPLDGRYFDSQVTRYLSEGSRVTYQAHVEAALAHTLAEYGLCTNGQAEQIEKATRQVTATEVFEEEKTTKHDVKALVNCIKRKAGPEAQAYVHFGATSYDIVATALTLQFKAAVVEVIEPRLLSLLKTLITLTDRFADTTQIGRTHGQHAVPITFGFAMAEYVERLGSSRSALRALSEELPGKFSGATGSYNALSLFVDDPLAFETSLLGRLGLQPAPYSTQIIPPEYFIRLIDELHITAGIMANLANDMRHLQRSEIAEVRERFEQGQTGSSTMAHKRNPWNFENVVSMSKQVTAQLLNANLNLSSEHQRDLTDSASVRFYSLAIALVAEMAQRLDKVMGKLEVDEEAMQRNLALSGGAIAAEPLYLLMAKYGHPQAHEKAKELSQKAMKSNALLHETVAADAEALKYWDQFTESEKAVIQDPVKHYSGLAAQKARLISAKWKKA